MQSKVFYLTQKRNNILVQKKKQYNKKNKMRVRLTIQSICIIFCALCFIYQTQQLVNTYLSGKTIVETRVERFRYSEIPAITVCLPTLLALNKIAENYLKNSSDPELNQLYQEYKQIRTIQQLEKNFNKVKWKLNLFDIPIDDLFEKVGMDDLEIVTEKTSSRAFNEQGKILHLPHPVQYQSIVPFNDARKCFTFFSDYDPEFANVSFELKYFEIWLRVNPWSYPPTFFNKDKQDLHIAVHSPNILPDFTKENLFLPMKMGKVNFVTYSESKSILLPPPYLTKCKNYDLKGEGMRTDCINRCVDRKMEKELNIDCVWSYENYRLISKHSSKYLSSTTICDTATLERTNKTRLYELVDMQFEFESQCQSQCPKNCLETYYNYEHWFRGNSDYDNYFENFWKALDIFTNQIHR